MIQQFFPHSISKSDCKNYLVKLWSKGGTEAGVSVTSKPYTPNTALAMPILLVIMVAVDFPFIKIID